MKQSTEVSAPSSYQTSFVNLFNGAVGSSGTALDGRMDRE